MDDTIPTTPSAPTHHTQTQAATRTQTQTNERRYPSAPDGWGAAPAAAPHGWDAAPTPTATRAPGGDPYAAEWDTAQQTPTPWYGRTDAPGSTKPRPPWFWPVVAAAVGVAALLAGGGIGFAIGHAIGGQTQSTSQFPGRGTNGFPGYGGGTGQFPGSTQGGTGTGTQGGTGTGTQGGTGTGS
ncbi:hypothetical protein Csp2054_05695 [Curtobacterium sp. 'Ferrero']|uniref:hypothetical protein n=1 Tax=Curtobacterium sp. 'Ferrero' TaxID=2033654 RepID=UPI000BDC1103|nr:hypothetical protein [Curtobacterium sp. 'Ferrero']PCN48593.1 hypothetical protein Csp2054_05695 [Curtobacterium sp. 'Ferrero']